MAVLAFSVALLGLAAAGPGYVAMRFRAVRLVESHREEIAFLGLALLSGTAVLFLLGHLPR